MALYAIGDLHLSLTANKPMEVFGPAWENYTERIAESLSALAAEDVLVLAGDTSWGMSLEEAEADFQFLDQFPCRKYLVKGNHDYWWTTAAKLHRFFDGKGIHTLDMLHNNCVFYGDYAVCGTRGWFLEEDAHNVKVLNREVGRLEASLKAAGERPILCFLHYPPLYQGYECPEILETLEKYRVSQCCYGHLHGHAIRRRLEGTRGKTEFSLISADYLGFVPKKICD
ncbi:MAG: serine/threonine protein phosphatase [Oscillibacter sp.]|jgi:predicted phosphohydrolase|uniref:metallophosphoesterase n=1 Tax=uncultured Oscillibacter sp. TaxID=876091 RepID=UPI00216C471D|nr:metallophosphoesterase [uncultured Oscillibacter sp.]MCI9644801.1 serine/threonine protein phosphatase [Oscillibacter sp.]